MCIYAGTISIHSRQRPDAKSKINRPLGIEGHNKVNYGFVCSLMAALYKCIVSDQSDVWQVGWACQTAFAATVELVIVAKGL